MDLCARIAERYGCADSGRHGNSLSRERGTDPFFIESSAHSIGSFSGWTEKYFKASFLGAYTIATLLSL